MQITLFFKEKTQTIDVQCKHDLNDKSYIVNVNCFFYYFFSNIMGSFQFNGKYILKKKQMFEMKFMAPCMATAFII